MNKEKTEPRNASSYFAKMLLDEIGKKRKIVLYHLTQSGGMDSLKDCKTMNEAISATEEIYNGKLPAGASTVLLNALQDLNVGTAFCDCLGSLFAEKNKTAYPVICRFLQLEFFEHAKADAKRFSKVTYDDDIIKNETRFFKMEDNKPARNFLYACYLTAYHLSIRFTCDFPVAETDNPVSLALILHMYTTLNDLSASIYRSMDSDFESLESEINQLKSTVENKDSIITEFKEKTRKLNQKLQEEDKSRSDKLKELKNTVLADKELLKEKDDLIRTLKNNLKSARASSKSAVYESLMVKAQEEARLAKNNADQKSAENKTLRKKVSALENRDPLEVFTEYLNEHGCDGRVKSILVEHGIIEEEDEKETLSAAESAMTSTPLYTQRIGYVSLEDGKWYMHFADKTQVEITVPENMYPEDKEFGYIDGSNRLYFLFSQRYEETGRELATMGFVGVNVRPDEPITFFRNNRYITEVKSSREAVYRNNCVLLVNSDNEILRFYKADYINADSIMPAVKHKGHEMYFTIKPLNSIGWMVVDVETGEETVKKFEEPSDIEIGEHQLVVCTPKGTVTKVIPNSRSYTMSSYYHKRQRGVAEWENGNLFIAKDSGEKALVKNPPIERIINEGAVIEVDEFNNYCRLLDTDAPVSKPATAKKRPSADKTEKPLPDAITDKRVIVVGNIGFIFSYSSALQRVGLLAKVVDGFDNYCKIREALKEACCVVVITNYVSHDNMWRIKKEITDIPVVYSDTDGSNRVAELAREAVQNIAGTAARISSVQ